MLQAHRPQVEVISQPSQDNTNCTRNGGRPEDEELGVMFGACADPSYFLLMLIVLRDEIDDCDGNRTT